MSWFGNLEGIGEVSSEEKEMHRQMHEDLSKTSIYGSLWNMLTTSLVGFSVIYFMVKISRGEYR
tara:strand:- start:12335 stop:12526 length:192 start_codon:yes stop_codon:yes gene_type:complete